MYIYIHYIYIDYIYVYYIYIYIYIYKYIYIFVCASVCVCMRDVLFITKKSLNILRIKITFKVKQKYFSSVLKGF